MEAVSGAVDEHKYAFVSPERSKPRERESEIVPFDNALSAEKEEYRKGVMRQYGLLLRSLRAPYTETAGNDGKVTHSGGTYDLIPCADLLNRRYRRLVKVGEGTFGEVFIVYDTTAETYLTMKRVFSYLHSAHPACGLRRIVFRELLLLSTLKHKNIGSIVEYHILLDGSLMLLMPLVAHDFSYLMRVSMRANSLEHQHHRMPLPMIKCIFRQILDGVAYMHKHKVIHRDLKPSNIMIDHDGTVKIIDFGWSRYWAAGSDERMTGPPCTVIYRPPEILLGGACVHQYNYSIDIWCCGCILFEMLTGGTRFVNGRMETEALNSIVDWLGSPAPDSNVYKQSRSSSSRRRTLEIPAGKESTFVGRCTGLNIVNSEIAFLQRLLHLEPGKRASAQTLLQDEWFTTAPSACSQEEIPLPRHNMYRWLESKRRYRQK